MKKLIAAAMLVLIAGCSSSTKGHAQATTPTTAGPQATATTSKPTTSSTVTSAEFGKTFTHTAMAGDGTTSTGKITLLDYRANAQLDPAATPRKGYHYAAILVRVCIVSNTGTIPPEVSWEPWTLNDDTGATYAAADSYSTDTLVSPLYPNGKVTPVGTCRKGWIPYALPDTWKPTHVEYNTGESTIGTWKLR